MSMHKVNIRRLSIEAVGSFIPVCDTAVKRAVLLSFQEESPLCRYTSGCKAQKQVHRHSTMIHSQRRAPSQMNNVMK